MSPYFIAPTAIAIFLGALCLRATRNARELTNELREQFADRNGLQVSNSIHSEWSIYANGNAE